MINYFMDEMACKCGCGTNNVSPKLLERINRAREISGIPFKVNRCCSCEKHNKDVGGKPDSSHIATGVKQCEAIDVEANDSRTRFKILNGLVLAEFTRIGIGKTFIHADVDIKKDLEVIWLY